MKHMEVLVRSGRSHKNPQWLQKGTAVMQRESNKSSGEIGPISPELSFHSLCLPAVCLWNKQGFW